MYEVPPMLPLITVVVIIASFVVALGLFALLLLKRMPKKDIDLYPINGRQDLTDNEAEYFAYIKYNQDNNSIVLKQSQIFKKCVVTLIIKKGGKLSSKRYNLQYVPGDVFCGINIEAGAEEFKVVLESVDGRPVKHTPIDSSLKFNVLYAVIVSVLFVIGSLLYVYMCNFYINGIWQEYATFYVYPALVIIYIIIIVGGYFLGELLSKKGVF